MLAVLLLEEAPQPTNQAEQGMTKQVGHVFRKWVGFVLCSIMSGEKLVRRALELGLYIGFE